MSSLFRSFVCSSLFYPALSVVNILTSVLADKNAEMGNFILRKSKSNCNSGMVENREMLNLVPTIPPDYINNDVPNLWCNKVSFTFSVQKLDILNLSILCLLQHKI